MAYRVSLTRRARRDLERLYESINAVQSLAAARWFNHLEATMMQLENSPRLGSVTRESPSVRQVIHGNKPHFYRILYEIDEAQGVIIVRQIRHGRRSAFNPAQR